MRRVRQVNRQIKGRLTENLDAAFELRERLLQVPFLMLTWTAPEARAEGWPALRQGSGFWSFSAQERCGWPLCRVLRRWEEGTASVERC